MKIPKINLTKAITYEEAVDVLISANNNNVDFIVDLVKANKRLACSVICLSIAGYLTWRHVRKQTLRIDELEKKLRSQTIDKAESK